MVSVSLGKEKEKSEEVVTGKNDNPVLIDKDITNIESTSQNALYPEMSYQINTISNFGQDIERQRLILLNALIQKRKKIHDIAIKRLDDLIVYCDNRILDIAEDDALLRNDPSRQKLASIWQKTILELEQQKISEQKELFRDVLFLRNENVKSQLSYSEQKTLSDLIKSIDKKSE